MCILAVRLFGKFQVQRDGQELQGLNTCKVWELFAYLLLYREHPHAREALASLLWPASTTEQAKKYLRHALWQLQTTLNLADTTEHNRILLVDPDDWICLNSDADLWLDVAEFERAYALVQKTPGKELDAQCEQTMRQALNLYRGDLLGGWYQDWCLFERERLQRQYLALLEKEMDYCSAHGEYETGLEFGIWALRYDVARERIHRRLMRLYYLGGNRTAALRQYERCVAFLRTELGVEPSTRTVTLYQQIRSELPLYPAGIASEQDSVTFMKTAPSLSQAHHQLKQLQTVFAEAECQLQKAIQAVEVALIGKG
jgi:DNA-binding SARP family transcriptional activator